MRQLRSCTLVALAFTLASSAAAQARPELTARQWTEDLATLVDGLEQWHANPYHTVTRGAFRTAAAELEAQIPTLAEHEIIVRLSRLVAMIGDTHTYLFPPREGPFAFSTYPVRFEWYDDGFFVQAADRSIAEVVGGRVVRIGNASIDAAIAAASEIGYRENEMTSRLSVPLVLAMPEVVHALGFVPTLGRAALTVETATGQSSVTLEPYARETVFDWVEADRAADRPLPLYRRDPEDAYWMEPLPAHDAIYVQFNRCEDKPGETIAAFADRLSRALEETGADRLILDVRNNVGGSWRATLPIVETVIRHPEINRKGHFFVLTGRYTLSATVVMIGRLIDQTAVTLVGEPTGARPNLYGENPFEIDLPNSGLGARWASGYYQSSEPSDRRPWWPPEVAAGVSSADFAARRDPVLDAALTYSGPRDLGSELEAGWASGGLPGAEEAYADYVRNPVHRYHDTLDPVRRFGNRLLEGLEEPDPEAALHVFEWNLAAYPGRARTHIRIGHALTTLGRTIEAREALEHALELLPDDPTLSNALRFALTRYTRDLLEGLGPG